MYIVYIICNQHKEEISMASKNMPQWPILLVVEEMRIKRVTQLTEKNAVRKKQGIYKVPIVVFIE